MSRRTIVLGVGVVAVLVAVGVFLTRGDDTEVVTVERLTVEVFGDAESSECVIEGLRASDVDPDQFERLLATDPELDVMSDDDQATVAEILAACERPPDFVRSAEHAPSPVIDDDSSPAAPADAGVSDVSSDDGGPVSDDDVVVTIHDDVVPVAANNND